MDVRHFEVMKFAYSDCTCPVIIPAITPAIARRMWRRYWLGQAKERIEQGFDACHTEISIMTQVEACLKHAERAESMIFARRTVPNYRRASARQRARMKMWR
jgi:hypothetical protein